MRAFVCQNPACGTDDARTVLGRIAPGPLLILPRDATAAADRHAVWWVRCPKCAFLAPWQGRIAKELRAA